MGRVHPLCLASLLLLIALPAAAEVAVLTQSTLVEVRAGSTCEGAPAGEDPDEERSSRTEPGDVDLMLEAARTTACGEASAAAGLRVQFVENGLNGVAGISGALERVGEVLARATFSLVLEVDVPTACRIDAAWAYQRTGDEPASLGGAYALFSGGPWVELSPGDFTWEGTLQPGEAYEFLVVTVVHRVTLNLPDGGYRSNDGTDDAEVRFAIDFGESRVVEGSASSIGRMKALR